MTSESSASGSDVRTVATGITGLLVLYGLVHLGTTVYLLTAPYGDSIADELFWINLLYGGLCGAPAFLAFVLAVTVSNKDQGRVKGVTRMFGALAFLVASIFILNGTNSYVQSQAPPPSFDVPAEHPLERDREGTAETTAAFDVGYRSPQYRLVVVIPATVTDSMELEQERETLERCLEEVVMRVTSRGQVVAADTILPRYVSLNRDPTPPVFEVHAFSNLPLKTGPACISINAPRYDASCPSVRLRFEGQTRRTRDL